jgi:hypothetical protein
MALVLTDLQSKTILEQPRGPASRDELKASTLPVTNTGANDHLSEAIITRRVELSTGAIATWALLLLPATTTSTTLATVGGLNRYKNLAAGSMIVCADGILVKVSAPGAVEAWSRAALTAMI